MAAAWGGHSRAGGPRPLQSDAASAAAAAEAAEMTDGQTSLSARNSAAAVTACWLRW